MTTLVLGLVGQAVGKALLPGGISLFGQAITGAEIGGAVGALAGSAVDGLLLGSRRVEGPRLSELHVQASTPGAPVPRVWGAMRLAGQVIWAASFKETEERHGGGKSGARVTDYTYTASFAVGLCEGVIGGVGRIWADGKPLALDGVVMRVHPGTEDQAGDPLILAVEGEAPAYRGLAYAVFEDLPLEPFGNRVPQLSFEVFRPAEDGDAGALERCVEAVCLIPGSGEFALATGKVLRDAGRGAWVAENANNRTGRTDIEASLDQLQAALPNVRRVALVVAWFGDDLRCGACRIRPGVELAEKRTHPVAWSVAGVTRGDAHVVSATEGRPNFGGTPDDDTVRQAIAALKARGMEVTLYPFVLMDVPPGNGLPDPYGGAEQAAFPWRGRITCHPAPGEPGSPDKTGAAADQMAAFFTGEWGLRRMALHYAGLAAEAGGVDAFLIGSELRGVTTMRSGVSTYPAVAHLVSLAAEVKALLPDAAVSYAADWTEWFGHHAADGSGDVHFHLDPLWASADVDFIGIDNYAPLADWRDGTAHLDYALSPSGRGDDTAYLTGNVEGGEGFAWYYASTEDRAAQIRTPIADTAYGKDWVFRPKDIRAWWANAHYDRPDGVEAAAPTAWVPEAKPVRFTELGCPAVDKGANQPNVFFDPRSSESALPYFSNGVRDDLIQRRALEAVIGHWRGDGVNPVSAVYGGAMIDIGRAHVWAWDARPFPDWPLRAEVWADGPLWRTGHWLNGRAGVAPLGALVREICAAAGVSDVDVSGLRGACAGYAIDRTMSAREALAPLMTAFAFEAAESQGQVRFFHRDAPGETALTADGLAEPEEGASAAASVLRAETVALPVAAKVSFIDPLAEYRADAAEARLNAGPSAKLEQTMLPLALTKAEAEAIAARTLHEAWTAREQVSFALPPSRLALEPGDAVRLEGRAWRLTRVGEGGRGLVEAGRLERQLYAAPVPVLEGALPAGLPAFGPALTARLDLAPIAFGGGTDGLRLAVFASPWPGVMEIWRGSSGDGAFAPIALVTRRAVLGETASLLRRGPVGRWDRRNTVDVMLYGGTLAAAEERAVLDGANRAAVETAPGVWEVLQFAGAELVGPETWRLSGLLRGQAGSAAAMAEGLAAGARFVLLDAAVAALPVTPDEAGDVVLRVVPAGLALDDVAMAETADVYAGAGRLPWTVCQIRARRIGGDVALSWVRRARDDAGRWGELEVGLGEEAERYRAELLDGGDVVRAFEVSSPGVIYDAAMQAADWGGPVPSPLTLRVAQVSPRYGRGAAVVAVVRV
ncbi:MAG: glycoside hydrolase/phage tail family protein [Alphaproteobacteria bacterium]|nr:glycoside hydrolase/phage tail family protein [Alphaproteobacteria bacterium]